MSLKKNRYLIRFFVDEKFGYIYKLSTISFTRAYYLGIAKMIKAKNNFKLPCKIEMVKTGEVQEFSYMDPIMFSTNHEEDLGCGCGECGVLNKKVIKSTIIKVLIICVLILLSTSLYAPGLSNSQVGIMKRTLEKEYIIEILRENIELKGEIFKRDIAFKESSNDWRKWNRFGYIGKYQFGKAALKTVGYNYIKFKDFIKDPNIFPEIDQERAMDSLLLFNKYVLKDYLSKYIGSTVHGFTVTELGMLAAAHLAGPTGVKKYLDSKGKRDVKDMLGTKLSDYMNYFDGVSF